MKKNILKHIIIFAILFVGSFWAIKETFAEGSSPCFCLPPGSSWQTVGTCSDCPTACAGSFDLGGHNFTQRTCGEPDPDVPGAKKCFCQIQITDPPAMTLDECIDGCAGYGYTYSWTAPAAGVDEGDVCSTQEDCSDGGTCGADRCYCNSTSNTCRFKIEKGNACEQNVQCISGYCYYPPASDRSQKICLDASLRPEGPGVDTTPESEVFPTYNINSPIGEVTGPELIGRIIKTVLGIVGALALAMFIYGGLTWLTSGGSPDKIKKGKDILMWAVIGLVVIFSSYTLVDFLLKAFGL